MSQGVLRRHLYCFVVGWVLLKLVGLHVAEEHEDIGLDLAEHNERAYSV